MRRSIPTASTAEPGKVRQPVTPSSICVEVSGAIYRIQVPHSGKSRHACSKQQCSRTRALDASTIRVPVRRAGAIRPLVGLLGVDNVVDASLIVPNPVGHRIRLLGASVQAVFVWADLAGAASFQVSKAAAQSTVGQRLDPFVCTLKVCPASFSPQTEPVSVFALQELGIGRPALTVVVAPHDNGEGTICYDNGQLSKRNEAAPTSEMSIFCQLTGATRAVRAVRHDEEAVLLRKCKT